MKTPIDKAITTILLTKYLNLFKSLYHSGFLYKIVLFNLIKELFKSVGGYLV